LEKNLAWLIEFAREGKRDFVKLDKPIQRRIYDYLHERIATADDVRSFGKALRHSLSGLWCYRVGDYRLVCKIEDDNLTVLVVQIGHRSSVYD
jgi:mRNA interferase RelE/StbE